MASVRFTECDRRNGRKRMLLAIVLCEYGYMSCGYGDMADTINCLVRRVYRFGGQSDVTGCEVQTAWMSSD
jgi:hypothetical protein